MTIYRRCGIGAERPALMSVWSLLMPQLTAADAHCTPGTYKPAPVLFRPDRWKSALVERQLGHTPKQRGPPHWTRCLAHSHRVSLSVLAQYASMGSIRTCGLLRPNNDAHPTSFAA